MGGMGNYTLTTRKREKDIMDYKQFQRMGGVHKYGFGDRGLQQAREELDRKKRVLLYQKVGIGFAILSFIATLVLIVMR